MYSTLSIKVTILFQEEKAIMIKGVYVLSFPVRFYLSKIIEFNSKYYRP
jgi:hypothetical protein